MKHLLSQILSQLRIRQFLAATNMLVALLIFWFNGLLVNVTLIMSVKFSVLSDVLIENKYKDKKVFYAFVKKQFNLSDTSFELYRKFVDQFVTNHKWRWQTKSKFSRAYFEKHFGPWLSQTFVLPDVTYKDAVKKDFAECSLRTKKRRGEELPQEKTPEEIQLAFIANLSHTDKDGAQIVKKVYCRLTM